MKVDMNIDMNDFMHACEATISRVSRGTRVAAQEGGTAILQAAQARCPRFTGTLMNSGRVSVEGSSADNYRQGFSATITFGGGDAVNPLTGQHPSEYAAAVHEGFAVNPITGEMSSYRTGEPKFLEKAIRAFEDTGLQKLAYKRWGAALKYFGATQRAEAEDRYLANTGKAPIGAEVIEVTRAFSKGGYTTSLYTTALKRKEFFSDSIVGVRKREMTKIFMGVDTFDSTPGVTDENLFRHYLRNQSIITRANIYAQGFAVSEASDEVIALAAAFKSGGVYALKGKSKPSKLQMAKMSHAKVERERMAYEDWLAGDDW